MKGRLVVIGQNWFAIGRLLWINKARFWLRVKLRLPVFERNRSATRGIRPMAVPSGVKYAIIGAGIRVIGHIGMLPQRVREEGGYKKKGKSEADLRHLIRGAEALQLAGVDAIIIESTVPAAAEMVIKAVQIPVIGIGAGKSCDGQIRVVHDILGSFPWFVPRFAKTYADLASETTRAAKGYIQAVREKWDA